MIKFFQKLKAKKGFTLVELIVVIAIIGVLAAILIPTMLGYVTSSRVTSADSTTASLKNNVDTFLTNADTAGYGMKLSSSATATLSIEVDANGEWSITVGGASAFSSTTPTGTDGVGAFKSKPGVGQWTADKKTTESGKSKIDAGDNAQLLLAYELKALFPDVKGAAAEVYLEGGKAKYAWYTADAATVAAVAGCPKKADFDKGTSKWDNNTAGVSTDGYIIGTAPKLSLGNS